jgi:hypothetical protein
MLDYSTHEGNPMRHHLTMALMAARLSICSADSRGDIRWRKGSDRQLSKRQKTRAAKKRKKLHRKQGRQ